MTIHQIKQDVADVLHGWTNNIEAKGESDQFYYLQGIATNQPDDFNEGDTVSIRVHKQANEGEHLIEGFVEGAGWRWLNSIYK